MSRRREGPKQKHRRTVPTDSQKRGAIRAEQYVAERVLDYPMRGGRKLGDIRMHELRAIADAEADAASSFLVRGYEDAAESILCQMLLRYTVPADPHATVRETFKPKVVADCFRQARIAAAEVIRDGSAKVAKDLIAAGQKQRIDIQ